MKRIMIVALILMMVLMLAACATGNASTLPPVEEHPAQEQPLANEQAPEQEAPQANEPPSAESPAPEQPQAVEQAPAGDTLAYVIVDTGQNNCYDASSQAPCPQAGQSFYGQDAQYAGVQPRYTDNGDGTVTDLNTGLMWQQTPDLDNKSTYFEAVAGAGAFNLGGYDDWRLPTIKELYSLINFNGSQFTKTPYIDTDYFDFVFGDESKGERAIDAQYWSSTEYLGTTMRDAATVFGVNFADGRIKGYPRDTGPNGSPNTQFVRYVRGNPDYGVNDLNDNGDESITDLAIGLTWQKNDSGSTMNWENALAYCESLDAAGYDDWRLPNAKELQSIVDYGRAPDAQNPAQQGPAIDPIFGLTEAESWFWTGTTLLESPPQAGTGSQAVYVTFGQAFGVLNSNLVNVHGAGAQRSDPKSGDPNEWADGRGPQGDQIRIYNYARCVRGGAQPVDVSTSAAEEPVAQPPADSQAPAGEQPPAGQGPPEGTPPQQAIDACSSLSENAPCQFTSPRGDVTGTCASIQSQLVCAPQGGPPSP